MSESRKNSTLTLAVFLLLVSGAALFVTAVLFVRARQYAGVEDESLAEIRMAADQERRENAERMSRIQVEMDAVMAKLGVAEDARAEAEKRAKLFKNQGEPLRRKAADLYREKTAAEKTALDARKDLAAAMARLKKAVSKTGKLKSQLRSEKEIIAAQARDKKLLLKKLDTAEKKLSELQAEISKLHEQIKALQKKPTAPAVKK